MKHLFGTFLFLVNFCSFTLLANNTREVVIYNNLPGSTLQIQYYVPDYGFLGPQNLKRYSHTINSGESIRINVYEKKQLCRIGFLLMQEEHKKAKIVKLKKEESNVYLEQSGICIEDNPGMTTRIVNLITD